MPKDDIGNLFDEAEAHLKKGIRRSEKTITDGVLGPSPESAPMPPPGPMAPPRPRAKPAPEPLEPPELTSDPESSPPDFLAQEAVTKPARRRRREPMELASVYPNYPPGGPALGVTPSIAAQAEKIPLARLLVIIGTAAVALTSVITALGVTVVNIITALHPPSNLEMKKEMDALRTRVDGDFGVTLEADTRRKKDEELERKHEALGKKLEALEGAAVPIKVTPKKP